MLRRYRVQDMVIAATLCAFLVGDLATSSQTDGPLVLNVLLLAPAALSLVVRRAHPLVPMVVIAVTYSLSGFVLTDITQLAATLPPVLVAAYSCGRYAADARVPAAVAVLTVLVTNVAAHEQNVDNWVFPVVAFGAAMLTGRGLRTRALVAAELAERTERLAVEQDLRAAEAAVEERRRIARELHDVVAHTLSVMVVQAGAARRTLGRDTELAGEALDTVEATGRAALGELRRMLGFVGAAGAGESEAAPLDPQPTTADLGGLARRAGAAGLPTELRVEGAPGGLPAGEEVAVYRIVQEALTNALKHAGPGATATVTVRWRDDAVEVEVVDRGGAGARPGALPSGGHGLVGMRERVALFRGRFEAGPAGADGGFRVLAWLPREAASVAVGA